MPSPARWLWTPVLAYILLIFALSSIAHPPDLPAGADKDAHALLYAGLGALVVRALAGGWRRPVSLRIAIAAVALAAVYGMSDEFHQSFVPTRSVEALDVLADTIGAAIAAFALYASSAFAASRRTRV